MVGKELGAHVLPTILGNTFQHFQTFVWLRWKIRTNQLRNSSSIGRALAAVLLALILMVTVSCFVGGVAIGALIPRLFSREYYFLLWDGLVAAFVFAWVIHIATDLQRSDAITFERILHLPVSYFEAFAVNYLSSLVNVHFLGLIAFFGGLILGSCFSIGLISLLIAIPFLVFVFALTTLTYQLQGWLALVMENPRRRRLVMIATPIVIVALSQVPTFLASQFAKRMDNAGKTVQVTPHAAEDQPKLDPADIPSENQGGVPANVPTDESGPPALPSSENAAIAIDDAEKPSVDADAPPAPVLTAEEIQESNLQKQKSQRASVRKQSFGVFVSLVRILNLAFPPLWMAGCVESIISGTSHVIWLTMAMFVVGVLSIRRNYQQTIRHYRGEIGAKALPSKSPKVDQSVPSAESQTNPIGAKARMIEWEIPFVSESTAAIITMTWQTMMRAPEVKIYLILPFFAPIFLFAVLHSLQLPKIDELKAAIVVCGAAFTLFISTGILGNQFGFDRAGFRAFVLSPIRRDRILLGRNLATSLVLLLQTFFLALAIGLYFGISLDVLLSAILLSASMLPLYALMVNLMSILAPFPIAAGAMQPKHFDLLPVLMSLVLSMLMPMITGIALVPLGIEWLVRTYLPVLAFLPIAMLLSVLWLAGSLLIYRWLLPYEGKLLASKEQKLLQIVTSKIE